MWLALAALLSGCSADASGDAALAERLAAEGKTEEADAALARICPAAPRSDACRAVPSRLVSLRVDGAARAAAEARFLDAERHLLLALAAAERDAAAIEEKLSAPALREGVAWQRAVTLGSPEGRIAAMEAAARGTTPAAPVARAWLAKELPAIRARDVLSACRPGPGGACSEAIAAFRALGPGAGDAPEGPEARALIEKEDARRRALADEAEALLAGFRQLALLDRRYERCLALNADIPDPGTQVSHCHQTTYPRPSYARRRELATAFRRLLARAGDPAVAADLVARRAAAEATKLP